MTTIYLHGFASGPMSRKARYFRERLPDLVIPDLAAGDFENLTITSQLAMVEGIAGPGPVSLIGSSMGAYLAALFGSRHPDRVSRLVLMAPAFGFAARWPAMIGAEAMQQWLATGKLPVYHYAEARMRNLGLAMYEDSQRWEPEPDFNHPALIFHGINDTIVPIEASRHFAAKHPNANLTELNSDHELTDVLPEIWESIRPFLLPG